MINYYSKYLKYKNKYLKLKTLHGGTKELHNDYEPKKIEVDNTILNDFFKDANFLEQDKIREKYEAKTNDDDKKKLLDNIFSANKDLFCVFIKILNKCTKPEDEEKFNTSLNKEGNTVKPGKEKTEEEKKLEEERIAAEKAEEEKKATEERIVAEKAEEEKKAAEKAEEEKKAAEKAVV